VRAERTASAAFTVEFESEPELRDEHRTNLSFGALRIPATESVARDTSLLVTLRGPWGGQAFVQAKVVAALPDGLALSFSGNSDEILLRLLAKPAVREGPAADERRSDSPVRHSDQTDDDEPEKGQNPWDRLRGLSQIEKILLAAKADRSERAVLLQDSDPRVLLSILRNPRFTVDEVVRIAKSSCLNYQIAEVIMSTGQWMGNLDVRLALIHNAKTPPAFALRILPMLPDTEVRAIARAGTNMALKQAALRRLQGKS
jgi:hypothetical protein